LCHETAQQIITNIFDFYQGIGKLNVKERKKIEETFFPELAKNYYFASYSQEGLEKYVRQIVSYVRKQEVTDEHFSGWTTNRSAQTVQFFVQQEAG
jgi:hypothetical protein